MFNKRNTIVQDKFIMRIGLMLLIPLSLPAPCCWRNNHWYQFKDIFIKWKSTFIKTVCFLKYRKEWIISVYIQIWHHFHLWNNIWKTDLFISYCFLGNVDKSKVILQNKHCNLNWGFSCDFTLCSGVWNWIFSSFGLHFYFK